MVGQVIDQFKQQIMKQVFSVLFFSSLLFASCKKEELNNTEDRVGSSRVTRFPTFTMSGSRYQSIVKGSAYTEAGVTAKEGDNTLTVQTSGTVDVNTVGVYDITYTAINKDGFPGSVTRTVAVLPAAEQAGVNISGKYKYATSAAIATIEKLAPGFYLADNVWSGATVIPSYVITVDGTNLVLPLNSLSAYGRLRGTGTLDATGNLTYRVDLLDQGITASVRRWIKQ
jgi:hypothetical protein